MEKKEKKIKMEETKTTNWIYKDFPYSEVEEKRETRLKKWGKG